MKKLEQEFLKQLGDRDLQIKARDHELEKKSKELEDTNKEWEEKVKQVQAEMEERSKQTNQIMDVRLEFEAMLDKKDQLIHDLMEQIVKLKDDIKGKD